MVETRAARIFEIVRIVEGVVWIHRSLNLLDGFPDRRFRAPKGQRGGGNLNVRNRRSGKPIHTIGGVLLIFNLQGMASLTFFERVTGLNNILHFF